MAAIDHVIGACKLDKMCVCYCKVKFSSWWTAEIENLYDFIYANIMIYHVELFVKFWQCLIKNWSYNAGVNFSTN